MRIVAHNGARIWGGAERALSLALAGLRERGHEVRLLCNSPLVRDRAAALGVPAELLPLGGDVMLPHALRLARALRRQRPDAFVVGTYRKIFLAALGARLAGVPRVVARVGLQTDRPRSAKYRLALGRWVDAVVVNSATMRAPFLALPNWTEARVVTIHNGVGAPAPGGELRAALGIPPGAPVVGALARLDLQKHLERLIGAVATLPGVHCLLAGEGEKRAELEALARELGVSERVRFLGYRSDAGEVLGALDALVICSNREGMSSAMLEALAAGVPVVSTRVSGAEEALEPLPDGTAPGVIVGFEVEEIAAALRSLLADPERRRRMGEAGVRRWRERFTPERMIDAWERVLERPR